MTSDRDLPLKLDACLAEYVPCSSHGTEAHFQSLNFNDKLSPIIQQIDLSLVEFQAPLFAALCISPILLFRTRLLQSSRVGRNHFVPVSLMYRFLSSS